MYTPQNFKINDRAKAFQLMKAFPFATVISVDNNLPMISHLPLTPLQINDEIVLIGHLAKANPHWKVMKKNKLTAIFHGPQTYITPQWYVENDVPTWNYVTVHATGAVDIVEDSEGLIHCLKHLTEHSEELWPSGWNFFIPDDLAGGILPRSIVGFKMKVQELHFKMKLSQNRSKVDREGILKGLATRKDDQSLQILKMMTEIELINR